MIANKVVAGLLCGALALGLADARAWAGGPRGGGGGRSGPARLNGNARSSTKPQYNYVIGRVDRQSGVVQTHKYGITGGSLGRNGLPDRANGQVSRLNRQSAGRYQYRARIDRRTGNRDEALGHEQHRVNQYYLKHQKMPPGMQRPRPTVVPLPPGYYPPGKP